MMKFLDIQWYDRLPSTNSALMECLSLGEILPSGFVIAAREQTAGRGRYNRRWVAEAGQNLTFSFVYVTSASVEYLSSLPMAITLGLVDMLRTYGIEAQVKWPNDVFIEGGKVCGMLLERSEIQHKDGTAIVVGIGLNVNMNGTAAALINRPATSMRIETGREFEVAEVLNRVLEFLPRWLDRWEKGGFPALREAWLDRCVLLGQPIRVGEGASLKTGVLEGFGTCGQLKLRSEDGSVQEIWAGDVAAI